MPSQASQLPLLDSPFESFEARKETRKTLLGFSLVCLTGYFTDPPASFHRELVSALESKTDRRVLILCFRGSGKSTFGSLALPLWAALEYPDKYPFIILVADSSRQATLNISAIKHELETNQLIKQDYGEIKGNVIEDFSLPVPFPVKNKETIEKLIQCESQGVNIARPDSNGVISYGLLQFNGTSTWAEFATRFNLRGSPMVPADAIRMADAMISHGYLGRWTCARNH